MLFPQITEIKDAKHVLIIDGTNQLIRAYSIAQKFQKSLYGLFLSQIATILNKFSPTVCYVVFDGQGGNFVRQKIYSQYKSNRNSVTKIHSQQYSELANILQHTPIIPLRFNHVQGDDVVAHLVRKNDTAGNKVTIVSGDQDFYQLCSDNVTVWSPIKKLLIGVNQVKSLYGTHPINFPIVKSIMGDASDNIPGISGIGLKTIIKYLRPILQNDTPVMGQLSTFRQQVQKLQFSNFKIKILNEFDNLKLFFKLVNLRNGCVISPQIGMLIDGKVDSTSIVLDRTQFVKQCNKYNVLIQEQAKIISSLYMIKRNK